MKDENGLPTTTTTAATKKESMDSSLFRKGRKEEEALHASGLPYTVALSVILTAAGVLIATLGDFSFDLFGYSMAFVSIFFLVIR
ncbi:hypothetical protein JHK87_050251 [Glycine soja]|nr:hypothetical protein JHK87_050251 [Glycine soja]